MSADSGEERAKILRLRANNQWYRNRYADAIEDTIEALRALGIEIDKKVSQESVDTLFNEIATALEKLGFDQLANLPRAPSMDLAIALLNDAGCVLSLTCCVRTWPKIWFAGINAVRAG